LSFLFAYAEQLLLTALGAPRLNRILNQPLRTPVLDFILEAIASFESAECVALPAVSSVSLRDSKKGGRQRGQVLHFAPKGNP
jgi:hypothetical protein